MNKITWRTNNHYKNRSWLLLIYYSGKVRITDDRQQMADEKYRCKGQKQQVRKDVHNLSHIEK